MTFAQPIWLAGLFAIPLLLWLEWWAARRRAQALERLVGDRKPHALLEQWSPRRSWTNALLRLAALALLLCGAARPEWGREVVKRGARGSDVVLLVDVSASMDTRDVPPSRLSEAKRQALAVIERMGGGRVGVVAFAGEAARLCPLTLDYSAARLVIESLSSVTVSAPGSNLGVGLRMAMSSLPPGNRNEQVVVLWSDGEDLEQGAKAAIDVVRRSGVRVLAVGVGTRDGDVVPVLDQEDRAIDVKRDEQGNVVRSRLDEELLRQVARSTHGGYFSADRPGGELARLLGALGSVATAARGDRLVERPRARFGSFALLAAVLLGFERARPRRRRGAREETTPIHSEKAAAAAAALLLMLAPLAAEAQSPWAKGDRAFRAGRFAAAESLYALRLKQGAPPAVRINRATAQALKGQIPQAVKELEGLASRPDRAGGEATYNLGTLLGQQRQHDQALAALRRALVQNPNDQDARWNYEVVMRAREQQKRPNEPDKKPDPKQKPEPNQPNDPRQGGSPQQPPQQPPPEPSPGSPQPQAGQSPKGEGGGPGQMNRGEAERLLDALHEMSRAHQGRAKRVRVMRDRQTRDW